MNEEQRSVEDTEVTAVALGWLHRFLRCDISALPAEELAEWAQWSAHEPNLEHFRRLSQTWRNLGPALAGVPTPADADVATDDYDGSEPVFEWLEQRSSQRKPWRLPPPGKFWAMAALIPLLVFAVVRFGHQMLLREMLDDRVQAYSTGPSEHRIVELPDGSKITLGARTELSTHYTANRRVIFLDRGEAWFDVAHNPSRPFTVLAGVGAITALGTQFDVRRELDSSDVEHVTVTVGTGTVEVGPPRETISSDNVDTVAPSPPKWTREKLVKGQQLTYGADGRSGAITTADLEAATAWKEGRLEYRQTPFRIVIPRVNRYSEKPIELADDEVAELPYSGTVFEGQVADWLRALQTAYPIEVVDTPDRIVIRSRGAVGGQRAGQAQPAPQ